MANPYRKVMYRLKEKWSIREIAELYVDRNFSMDLVSHITGIPLALLSHILWDYHLPKVKSKYYTENFLGEIPNLQNKCMQNFSGKSGSLHDSMRMTDERWRQIF